LLYEVGERYLVVLEEVFRGTLDELKRYPGTFKPGLVYEVLLVVEPPIADVSGAYDVLRYLESRYPCIGINYLGISDDGRTVVVQLFDPPGIAGVAVAIVVIAIATAVALYFGAQFVKEIRLFLEKLLPPLPPPPPWLAPAVWVAVAAVGVGVGTYLLKRALRG
jgi:hypothetical protein